MSTLRILPFGACQLGAALTPLMRDRRIVVTSDTAGIWNFSCYTLPEGSQRIRFARGEVAIPKNLYRYCALPDDLDPESPSLRLLEDADLVLLEPTTSICTLFGRYALNRAALLSSFVNILAEVSRFAAVAANDWFLRGLMGCNDDRLRQAAEYLVPLLPGRVEDVETVRELLRGMRGVRQNFDELVAGVDAIKTWLVRLSRSLPLFTNICRTAGRSRGRPTIWIIHWRQRASWASRCSTRGTLSFPMVWTTRWMTSECSIGKNSSR